MKTQCYSHQILSAVVTRTSIQKGDGACVSTLRCIGGVAGKVTAAFAAALELIVRIATLLAIGLLIYPFSKKTVEDMSQTALDALNTIPAAIKAIPRIHAPGPTPRDPTSADHLTQSTIWQAVKNNPKTAATVTLVGLIALCAIACSVSYPDKAALLPSPATSSSTPLDLSSHSILKNTCPRSPFGTTPVDPARMRLEMPTVPNCFFNQTAAAGTLEKSTPWAFGSSSPLSDNPYPSPYNILMPKTLYDRIMARIHALPPGKHVIDNLGEGRAKCGIAVDKFPRGTFRFDAYCMQQLPQCEKGDILYQELFFSNSNALGAPRNRASGILRLNPGQMNRCNRARYELKRLGIEIEPCLQFLAKEISSAFRCLAKYCYTIKTDLGKIDRRLYE